MTNNVIRIELDFDSSNSTITTAITTQLGIIDAAGGSLVGYSEGFNEGMNNYVITFIYTTP